MVIYSFNNAHNARQQYPIASYKLKFIKTANPIAHKLKTKGNYSTLAERSRSQNIPFGFAQGAF